MTTLSLCYGAGREAASGRLPFSGTSSTGVFTWGHRVRGPGSTSMGFCEVALPRNDIESVRFFTARLDPSRGHGAQRERQDTYLLALEELPRLTVHFGELVVNRKRQRLVNPRSGGPESADVWVPEEKGSDVNLASYLAFPLVARTKRRSGQRRRAPRRAAGVTLESRPSHGSGRLSGTSARG